MQRTIDPKGWVIMATDTVISPPTNTIAKSGTDLDQLARQIVELVGGPENVNSVTHCITRLRFMLKDDSIAKTDEIKKLNVLGVVVQGGQYQVIVGNTVSKTYKALVNQYPNLEMGANSDSDNSADVVAANQPKGIKATLNRGLGTLSSILVAALPPLIGGGMLRGITFIFTNYGILPRESSLNWLLTVITDCMFYFFPFLLAVSAAKKLKTNEYMAIALAGALMYPTLLNAAVEGADPIQLFGFLPIPMINYSSSIIPIILAVILLKHVYGFFEKHLPDMVRTIFAPVLTLLIVVPLMLAILAPLGYYGGVYVADGVQWLIDAAPWAAGFVIGATRPLLVIVGMHHAIRPIQFQQIATYGYTTITPANFMSTMATATATTAAFFLLRNKDQKTIAASSAFSAWLGITEPAVYGILTRYKAVMAGALLGGGLGGMVTTMMGGRAYASGMPSILTIPIFMGGGVASVLVGLAVTVGSAFAITMIAGKLIFKANDVEITDGAAEVAAKKAAKAGKAAPQVIETAQLANDKSQYVAVS